MTDQEYIKAARVAYELGLKLTQFARLFAHCHVGMKDLNHAVRTKLYRLRKAGHNVPLFSVDRPQRIAGVTDESLFLAHSVIDYMESLAGPLHELWDDDLIFSHDQDGVDADDIDGFKAVIDDIRDGKAVFYQSESQADDREAHESINVYLNARKMLEALDNEPC